MVCFENKESIMKTYLQMLAHLCKGKKATEVFEIKGNKIELKASKLERKGIRFCDFLEKFFCARPHVNDIIREVGHLKVEVIIVGEGLFRYRGSQYVEEETRVQESEGSQVSTSGEASKGSAASERSSHGSPSEYSWPT